MIALYNNQFVDDEITIPINSKAFMYGFGTFETMRTHNGKIFRLEDHLERLFKSAETIGLKVPNTKAEIEEMLTKMLSKITNPSTKIKIVATEDGILIIATDLEIDSKLYEGVALKSVITKRMIPSAKSLAYMDSYMPHKEAVDEGFYDALIIDESGEVYEAAYANIFWFEEGTLCTRDDKVLSGITRKAVLEISPFPVEFKTIKLEELKKASGVFLTQSTKGIVPVTKIDETEVQHSPELEKLMDDFTLLHST